MPEPRKEASRLIGDCIREIAPLVVVFLPLEAFWYNKLSGEIWVAAIAIASACLHLGIKLEGRDEL